MDSVGVIVVAGGSGTRMGSDVPKQFLPLCGVPILVHTVRRFLEALPSANIVIAIPSSEKSRWTEISDRFGITGTHKICEGGDTRFASVKNALCELPECDYVMVHDGVRPLFSDALLIRGMETVRVQGTAVPTIPVTDSVRELDADGSRPVDRDRLRAVQTPQFFSYHLLKEAYNTDYSTHFTDDASVVEAKGIKIALFDGEDSNIKITNPLDLLLAEQIIKSI